MDQRVIGLGPRYNDRGITRRARLARRSSRILVGYKTWYTQSIYRSQDSANDALFIPLDTCPYLRIDHIKHMKINKQTIYVQFNRKSIFSFFEQSFEHLFSEMTSQSKTKPNQAEKRHTIKSSDSFTNRACFSFYLFLPLQSFFFIVLEIRKFVYVFTNFMTLYVRFLIYYSPGTTKDHLDCGNTCILSSDLVSPS